MIYTDGPCEAEVVADSISQYGIRITTLRLRYPRFIHAEFMTHRVFSRNARSSRAVPVKKLLLETPYIPHFLANQKGMQAFDALPQEAYEAAVCHWETAIAGCKDTAETLGNLGVHKQWANRMIEWFGYIDVLVTSTHWSNFFNLRDHPMAMPEIQALARCMREAMDYSRPVFRTHSWHLPYVEDRERLAYDIDVLRLLSTARSARISYAPFTPSGDLGTIDNNADMALAERLIGSEPLHASPAEHQATPDYIARYGAGPTASFEWAHPEFHGNFYGWQQFRKMCPGENLEDRSHSIDTCLEFNQNYLKQRSINDGETLA